MQNKVVYSSDTFFNFNHWLSFIANKKQVWISKAYNAKTDILQPNSLRSNSIFYPLNTILDANEEIIQTSGGLFNFFYLTNLGKIFQIGNKHQHDKNEFLPVSLPNDLDSGEKITQIMIKETASILISNKQKIYVLGQNKLGELGLPPCHQITHFTRVPLELAENETITKFVTSNKDTLIESESFLNFHSAFFTNHNRLFVCGSNFLNELGIGGYLPQTKFIQSNLPLEDDSICDIAVSSRATFVLTYSGKLFISGSYVFGCHTNHLYTNHTFKEFLLPKLNHDEKLIQISAGRDHCIILSSKGRLLVSGKNSFGELGLGHLQPQVGFSFTKPLLLKNEKISQIACINHQSVIRTNANRILLSGQFFDATHPTHHKINTQFKSQFYPEELYQSQKKISRILMFLSIASFTGAIFSHQVLHVVFLVAGTSCLLPALYIYLLSKHSQILFQCEQNHLDEMNQSLGLSQS